MSAAPFGIITTISDCPVRRIQAEVLGRQLQRWWPEVPRAVIGKRAHIASLATAGWQVLAHDDHRLVQGFESKLELWRYSPFEVTLFLDADILPVGPIEDLDRVVGGLLACSAPVSYYGRYLEGGEDHQGTVVGPLQSRGIDRLWGTIAGGHYLWRRGRESEEVFSLAAQIGREKWPEVVRYLPVLHRWFQACDETLVAIALAKLHPDAAFPREDVFLRAKSWTPELGEVRFLHFIADSRPWLYLKTAREGGASYLLCGAVLLRWTLKMGRKFFLHHRYGGARRVRSSLQMV